MTYVLDDLLSGALALTVTLLAAAALTLALSVVSFLGSLIGRKPSSRGRRLALSIPPLVAAFAFAVSLALLVGDARAEIVSVVRDPLDPSEAVTRLALYTSAQLNGLWIGSMLAALVLPLGIVGGCFPWALSSRSSARSVLLALAAGSAVPLAVAAYASASYAGEVILAFGAVANADLASKATMLSFGMDEAGASLDSARLAVGGMAFVAALGATLLAFRAARTGSVAGNRAVIGALGVALLGAAALVATRGMAHDTRHPVPPDRDALVRFPPHLEPLFLARCEPLSVTVPVLVVSETETRMDGRTMASPEDVIRDLETLRRNWSILHPREPAPDAVGIASDERTPLTVLAPWLRAAQAAGFTHADVLSARVTTIETETQGSLERRTACGLRFTLDAEGTPVGQYPSWRALASAAESGGLRVAP